MTELAENGVCLVRVYIIYLCIMCICYFNEQNSQTATNNSTTNLKGS